jgi:hypothetical protein
MSMVINRARLLAIALAIVALGACSAADLAAPARTLGPAKASFDGDTIPNALFKSGYSGVNGRCTDEQ